MIHQLVSILGAAMILGAYAALQRRWLGLHQHVYHVLNFVGSALLTTSAVRDGNIGFIMLEGSWALLSIPGMFRPPPATLPNSAQSE